MTGLLSWSICLAALASQVYSQCCPPSESSSFCTVFHMLSPMEQGEVMTYLGENCEGDANEALKTMEKRKPNFMRYGRSMPMALGKKGSDPNFLRFGRSQPNFLRFGKAAGDPNFLRFGNNSNGPKIAPISGRSDPNFLRFGKAAADPNFLRFGKRSVDPNFLRFGRAGADQDGFDRESRKPNFLRFGK